jgi:hypothetical protein
MIITYIHSTNPEDHFRVQLRCRNFADAINRFGWHAANLLDLRSFIEGTPDAYRLCAASDLLIIHRYLYGPVFEAIEYWKARDKKVIVDLDEAIDYLTSEIPGYSFWMESEPIESSAQVESRRGTQTGATPLEQFKSGLSLIDAAIVSSARLVMDWSPFTSVYEVPDYLNTDQYPAFKYARENEIWIGIANNTRIVSLKNSGLFDALANICRSHLPVKIVVCYSKCEREEVLPIPSSQLIRYTSNVSEEWADILLKLNLGLVPLCGDYDLRLGRINLLEFMISKTPWIASRQPCFQELSRYGKLVENSSNAWEAAILKALDNIDIIQKRAGGEPFLFALSQDVNENIAKVLKLFTRILNQAKRSGAE